MPRDYAKKSRPQTRRRAPAKKPVPAWIWLLVGGFVGAFVMFLIYLWGVSPQKVDSPSKTKAVASKINNKKAADDIPKPRFDFYKLLQESEVIVPATEPAPGTDKATDPAQDSMEYILQVGSFPKNADADKLRAQLILLNLDARIETVTIRNGELWHRVVVGPFDDQSRLAKARTILVENQYNALVLKRDKNAKP